MLLFFAAIAVGLIALARNRDDSKPDEGGEVDETEGGEVDETDITSGGVNLSPSLFSGEIVEATRDPVYSASVSMWDHYYHPATNLGRINLKRYGLGVTGNSWSGTPLGSGDLSVASRKETMLSELGSARPDVWTSEVLRPLLDDVEKKESRYQERPTRGRLLDLRRSYTLLIAAMSFPHLLSWELDEDDRKVRDSMAIKGAMDAFKNIFRRKRGQGQSIDLEGALTLDSDPRQKAWRDYIREKYGAHYIDPIKNPPPLPERG